MSQDDMRLSVHSAIVSAYQLNRPLVIVEGVDDLPIYTKISNEINSDIKVKVIELFKGCSPGCLEIENQLAIINGQYNDDHHIYSYFVGILDKDVKDIRGEIMNLPGAFYLSNYSFENHFVTKESLQHLVSLITSVTEDEIDDRVTDLLIDTINASLIDFFYATLEALKNSLEPGYIGLVGFAADYDNLLKNRSQDMQEEFNSRKIGLDTFAQTYNMNLSCILDMHLYCKGKWHLKYFLTKIQEVIHVLKDNCGSLVQQCQRCEINTLSGNNSGPCLYTQKNKLQTDIMMKSIKENIGNANFDDLKVKLQSLSQA